MIWLHFIWIMVVWRKRKIEEMVMRNRNENEKTLKRAKMKRKEKWEMEWTQKGRIKKGVRSLGWKIPKFTPIRLRIESVFEYERVFFGESLKTTVHCMIACKHLYHGCIWQKDLYYLSSVYLNILFKTKMTYLFCKFKIVDMLDIRLNKTNDNFDWFKFVWLYFF